MYYFGKLSKKIITLLFIIFLQFPLSPSFANENANSSIYTLKESIIIKNIGNTTANNTILGIPLMAEIDSDYQNVISTNYSIEPLVESNHLNRNKTAKFYLPEIKAQETIPIIITYTIRTNLTKINTEILGAEYILDHSTTYLYPEPKIESDTPLIKKTLKKIYPNETVNTLEEALALAKAAYKYTQDSLNYSLSSPAVNKGALAALEYGEGSCVEYASLFTALCRAGGVQARIVNGFANDLHTLDLENLKSNLGKSRHQWAEFYLPGQGWIPVDPTLAKPGRELFGSLPIGYYLIQNYEDLPVKCSYQGSNLNINFDYKIDKAKVLILYN